MKNAKFCKKCEIYENYNSEVSYKISDHIWAPWRANEAQNNHARTQYPDCVSEKSLVGEKSKWIINFLTLSFTLPYRVKYWNRACFIEISKNIYKKVLMTERRKNYILRDIRSDSLSVRYQIVCML